MLQAGMLFPAPLGVRDLFRLMFIPGWSVRSLSVVCLALISLCLPLEMILVVVWILSGMEPTADLLWTSGVHRTHAPCLWWVDYVGPRERIPVRSL